MNTWDTDITDDGPAGVTLLSELELTRRSFGGLLGAGLLITVTSGAAAQQRGRQALPVAARVHLGRDGSLSVMTGKVEEGQGARAELTQAAAEELRVASERVRLVMADTALVPDDGMRIGSSKGRTQGP